MKKLFLISALLLLFFAGRSQINYNSSTSKFTLSAPPGVPQLLERPLGSNLTYGRNPRSAFVFEFGDGNFTSDDIFPTHHYAKQGKYRTILTLSTLYDTIKPPQLVKADINFEQSPATPPQQQLLNPGERIRITSISSNLTVKDEMLFLITYIVPENAFDARVYFFYNQPSFPALEPATDTSTIWQPYASEDGILRLRTYFEETWNGTANLTNTNIPGIPNSLYQNLLAWNANSGITGTERNIFVTLRTKDNITQKHSILFQGALTYKQGKDSSTVIYNVDTLQMEASADPHDPNYLISTPRCLEKVNKTVPVKYHLHFQNMGAGDAYDLYIRLYMDQKLTDALRNLNEKSFTITVGTKPVTNAVFKRKENVLSFHIDSQKERFPERRSLHNNKVENWISNPLTMGDIHFVLDVPASEEADIVSYASVVFCNEKNDTMPPVLTAPDTLSVRDKCSENLFPRIKRMKQKPGPIDKIDPIRKIDPICENCCVIILYICWWWWIIFLVALTLAIIFWLLFRRRKEGDKARQSRK